MKARLLLVFVLVSLMAGCMPPTLGPARKRQAKAEETKKEGKARDAVEQSVINLAAEFAGERRYKVTRSSRLVEDLGFDADDRRFFIQALEVEYEIKIDRHDANNIRTVGQAVDRIKIEMDKGERTDE
jgi:acyl carrier protein